MDSDNRQEQEEAWKEQLLANPKVQDYLSRYKKSTLNSFLDGYVNFKYLSLLHGKSYADMLTRQATEGVEEALEHFKVIQGKKLLDLECLWRAEMTDIPELKNTVDFTVWSYKILDCPFLDPVNEVDIDWYTEFLSARQEMPYEFQSTYNDYQEYKDNYYSSEEGTELTAWYEFHNMKTGNTVLLTYPDIRGEQEWNYLQCRREAKHDDTAPKPV